MTTNTASSTPEDAAPVLTRAERREQARIERELARRPTPPFDGRHGAQDGVAWRELEPGVWKISDVNGLVAIVTGDAMDFTKATAALGPTDRSTAAAAVLEQSDPGPAPAAAPAPRSEYEGAGPTA